MHMLSKQALPCRPLLQQDPCHSSWLPVVGPDDCRLWALPFGVPGHHLLGHEWDRSALLLSIHPQLSHQKELTVLRMLLTSV